MISQVDEFEDFVNKFSDQMQDILKTDFKQDCTKKSDPQEIIKKADAEKLKGNEAFKAGNYSTAISCYDAAIGMLMTDSIPIVPVLYTNRALVLLKTNEFRKSLNDCNAAHKLDPKNIKAIWRRIGAFRGLREYHNALRDLEKLKKDFGNYYRLILSFR